MEETVWQEVANQFDDLYTQIEAIDSLAFVLMVAAYSEVDAGDLTGSLYLLSDATLNLGKKMKAINNVLHEKLKIEKAKVKDEE